MFTTNFDKYACFGDTITCEVEGFEITARIEQDTDSGSPWDEEDGHGLISDWTSRSKRPGERVLHEERGSYRYYDIQASMAKAIREGWDCELFGQGTPRERAARAVERDFKAMRAWCNDEWYYCGVVLSVAKNGYTLDEHAASLWGIELNYPGSENNDYLTEVANDLLGEALKVGREAVVAICGA